MEYKFYGADVDGLEVLRSEFDKVSDVRVLYDYLSKIWSRMTCAPRLRPLWSEENKTLGQCSITSFLIQDIFGGEVYGVPLNDGGFHCFNIVNDKVFDLTSEQFGNVELNYTKKYPQSREKHFSVQEKFDRYNILKTQLLNALNK